MSGLSTLTVQCGAGTAAAALEVAMHAAHAPTVVLTARIAAQLEREFRGHKRLVRWLVDLATAAGRPLAMHAAAGDAGQTIVIPPRDWTPERTAGWIAGRHAELEAQFGPITRVGQTA